MAYLVVQKVKPWSHKLLKMGQITNWTIVVSVTDENDE